VRRISFAKRKKERVFSATHIKYTIRKKVSTPTLQSTPVYNNGMHTRSFFASNK